ncbi:MAG: M56 family metallopeptidase [Myxococcota bacterium]
MTDWQDLLSAVVFEPFLFLQVKVAAIVAFALALDFAARTLAPAFRHTLWSAAVVCILVLPVSELLAPPLRWVAPLPAQASAPPLKESPAPVAVAPETAPIIVDSQFQATFPAEPSPELSDMPVMSSGLAFSWYWLYALGTGAFFLRRAFALRAVVRVGQRASRVRDESVDIALWRAADAIGLPRLPVVLRSVEVRSAYTWGTWKPRVLVPESSRHWSLECWEAVLLHELAHVKSGDWLRLMAGEVARCVHWHNPAVWVAVHRLAIERERACDASVLAHGMKPSTYAAHLLDLARGAKEARRLELAALSAHGGGLEGRIRAILSRKLPRSAPKLLSALAVVLLLGVSTAFAAVVPEAPAPFPESAALPLPPAPPAPAAPVAPPQPPELETPPLPPAPPVVAAAPVVPPSPSPAPVPSPSPKHRSMSSMHWQDDEREYRTSDDGMVWSLDYRSGDTRLRARFELYDEINMSRTGSEILSMGPDSRVLLQSDIGTRRNRLIIDRGADGKLEYRWRVGSDARPMDETARAWARSALAAIAALREARSLAAQRDTLRGQISFVRGQESSLRGKISSARGRQSSLRGRISSLRGRVSAHQGQGSNLRGQLSNLRGEKSALESKLRVVDRTQGTEEQRDELRAAI